MNKERQFAPEIQRLLDAGQEIGREIGSFLSAFRSYKNDFTAEENEKYNELQERAMHWFNLIKTQVLPRTLYSENSLFELLQDLLAAMRMNSRQAVGHLVGLMPQDAIREASEHIEKAMVLIRSAAPVSAPSVSGIQLQPRSSFVPNTAFVMMWMNKAHPELDDVANAIKEVCQSFGIRAFRADDVEHQDRITDVILDQIRNSEFLIADLSGERPNVYYEVGFAHALGKRPILYRREGTTLHFDLSVHNVPDYRNITHLKELLTKRFEALLGREPKNA